MTRITIKELIFDEWNIKHIQKHKVRVIEIILAGKNLIYHRKTKDQRYLAIGRYKKRLITLVIRRKSNKRYYLVTARIASKKERKVVYEKEK